MAKVINVGYTDTPIAGSPVLNLLRGSVNFKADFRVKQETPNEVVVTNLTSPVDRPERFRFAYSDVSDIYKGTDINPAVYAPSRRGVSVLCQLTEVISVTDTTDPSYRKDVPISVHTVLKVPADEDITSAMIQTALARALSGFYDTGLVTTDRIKAMVRGSLTPSDL